MKWELKNYMYKTYWRYNLPYKRLFILIEGNDDERFFKNILKPKFEKCYEYVIPWKYAQEKKIVSVEHAIRSQTSLAAQIMNWNDRGWIKEGYVADIAIIDIDNIETGSSIHNPHVYSKGVKYLLINGELAIDNEKYTGKLPGKIIKNRSVR